MKNRELLKLGQDKLTKENIEGAEIDGWLLFQYCFNMSKSSYFMEMNEEADELKSEKYIELINKRINHVPVQYLIGGASFYGREFFVNENVLIPRLDTEIVLLCALEKIKNINEPKVMDMCTGSGCIIESILLEKSCKEGVGVDISHKALEVAEINKRNFEIKNCTLIKSDLFNNNELSKYENSLDLLISNPPYIESAEIERLSPEVKDMEPRLALDGREDGLYFYRIIVDKGYNYLKNKGWLVFEIGYNQGERVLQLMKGKGYVNIEVKKDLAGLNRAVIGQKP